MFNIWIKHCPKCNVEMKYSKRWDWNKSIENNTLCISCCKIGRLFSKEHRKNISKKLMGNTNCVGSFGWHHSDETKSKIRCKNRGKRRSDETKKKLSLACLERFKNKENHPWYGKSRSEEDKIKISHSQIGKIVSEETRRKLSKAIKKSWKVPSTRKKYYNALYKTKWLKVRSDVGQLELLTKWNKLGFNFEPNYQLKADNFLCYVDGYDKEHNVVLEYDGKYHHIIGQQKRDLVRQKNIIDILHPKKFWRYNSVNKIWNEVIKGGVPDEPLR